MWKKIKIEKILLTSMIFTIGIIINIYIWYYISVQNRKDIIDSKLMYAASNIENLLYKTSFLFNFFDISSILLKFN